MIPILDAAQLRAADSHTIVNEPIVSLDLMERAAKACADAILDEHHAARWGDPRQVGYVVLVGMGNNGGDGLAIARLLHGAGMAVRVLRVLHRDQASTDHVANHQRLADLGVECQDLAHVDDLGPFATGEVIIDALLGTGLAQPVNGLLAEVIQQVNASGRPVIAIDMPSGLFCGDNGRNDPKGIIRASLTLTLQLPKLAMLVPGNEAYTGAWQVLPIGLDAAFMAKQPTRHHLLEESDVWSLLPVRPPWGHKGTFGHALVMAGTRGRMGAAVLAVQAALRSGTGLVSVHIPATGLGIMQTTAPEAMCQPDEQEHHLANWPDMQGITAVGFGPAAGLHGDTALVLKRLIQDCPVPMVLDADALNILAENRTWLAFLPPGTILTPHPREFDRLYGEPSDDGYQRLERASELARRHGCIVVLKGHWTAVCAPSGAVTFNPTGNPGMAKGGSGDVLTGLLAGLLAQRIPPLHAAQLGVYLHGLAGDIAADHRGMDGMTARDVVEALPEAWRHLRNASEESFH